MTEQEYLETFVKELHHEIELDKQKALMHKKMYGTWTTEEIISAMKNLCPEAWENYD